MGGGSGELAVTAGDLLPLLRLTKSGLTSPPLLAPLWALLGLTGMAPIAPYA